MKRVSIIPRPDWEQKILQQGLLFYKDDNYYDESAAYEFTYDEIATIETATAELHRMCLAVVEHVITNKLWEEFCIPLQYAPLIEWSWRTGQPSIYGRFDLGFNNGQVKMLEYNADTPTLLLESSVIQWHWLREYDSSMDQYNTIHEKLVRHIGHCKKDLLPGKLFFASPDNEEDYVTVRYMQDAAVQAGLETDFLFIQDICVNEQDRFTTPLGEVIANIFRIYPYEWLFSEPFGKYLPVNKDCCRWLEPPYKAILSNKMMLQYIYDLFPGSPYLLPCIAPKAGEKFTPPLSYARKPIFSREGENVILVRNGAQIAATEGEYGSEGFVYQDYFELPEFEGRYPIIGSWIIGGEPAGMGIRESKSRITNVTSSFRAHYISGE